MKNIDSLLKGLFWTSIKSCENFHALISRQKKSVIAIAHRINSAGKVSINYLSFKKFLRAKFARQFSTNLIIIAGFSIVLIFCMINFYNIKANANAKATQIPPGMIFFHEKITHHSNNI